MNEQTYDVVERSLDTDGQVHMFVHEVGVTLATARWYIGHIAWGYVEATLQAYSEAHPEVSPEELDARQLRFTRVRDQNSEVTFFDGRVVDTLLILPATPGNQASDVCSPVDGF